jgi:hypothetical protein
MAGPPVIVGPYQNVPVTQSTSAEPPLGDNRYDGYVTADPNDPKRLVGVCRRFYGAGINYQDSLEVQFSLDGGFTWSSSPLPTQDNVYSVSDPWIGFGPDSTVYVIGLPVVTTDGTTIGSRAAAQSLSEPAGQGVNFYANSDRLLASTSWLSGGSAVNQFVNYPSSDASDNTFGAVDLTPSSPYYGRIYAMWAHYGPGNETLAFAYSNDGLTWSHSAASPQNVPASDPTYFDLGQSWALNNMAVAPDGSIHLIGSGFFVGSIFYGRSTDGGNTFAFGVIASEQPISDCSGLFLGPDPTSHTTAPATETPYCIYAGNAGLVIAAWTVNTNTNQDQPQNIRIAVALCSDNGASWLASGSSGVAQGLTPALAILPLGNLPDTTDDAYFMPRLAGAPDGTVGCLFQHCQLVADKTLASAQFSTCLAVSHGFVEIVSRPEGVLAGAYFSQAATVTVPVSDEPRSIISKNPVFRYGNSFRYFIGDFLGLCANEFGFFCYWSDTRLGTGQLVVSRLGLSTSSALLPPQPPPKMVVVPDILGMTQAAGYSKVVSAGLDLSILSKEVGEDRYYGVYVEQVPAAGSDVTAGSRCVGYVGAAIPSHSPN